jgi:hypothetical protein
MDRRIRRPARSARTRIDTGAPNLMIRLAPDERRYRVEPSAHERLGGAAQPIAPDRTWHFPKDAQQVISLRVGVYAANLSTSDFASLHFEGSLLDFQPAPDNGPPLSPPEPFALYPDRAVDMALPWCDLEARFTAQQWSENWHAWEAGRELPYFATAVIVCTDRRDEDVVDTWRLRLTGCPIEPVPNLGDMWRPRLSRQVGSEVPKDAVIFDAFPPRERVHWISRSHGMTRPLPAYDDIPGFRKRAGAWVARRRPGLSRGGD